MRNSVLFGLVVASLVLLPHAMGVAQDGENVLLHEDFEGKEKRTRGKSSNLIKETVTDSRKGS